MRVRRGFTLVEILVVIVMIGIMMKIVVPHFRVSNASRVRQAARQLGADIELARTRALLGAEFPLVATNGARSGADAARMLLAGASAVEFCSAVMTGGFGVLGEAIAALSTYVERHDCDARQLIGRAADQVGRYADLPARPEHWRGFVPAATLGN